jgi:hypothetical protein
MCLALDNRIGLLRILTLSFLPLFCDCKQSRKAYSLPRVVRVWSEFSQKFTVTTRKPIGFIAVVSGRNLWQSCGEVILETLRVSRVFSSLKRPKTVVQPLTFVISG